MLRSNPEAFAEALSLSYLPVLLRSIQVPRHLWHVMESPMAVLRVGRCYYSFVCWLIALLVLRKPGVELLHSHMSMIFDHILLGHMSRRFRRLLGILASNDARGRVAHFVD